MRDPFGHATLGVGVFYCDPFAALEWLHGAFGFRRTMLVTDANGAMIHSEMRYADAYIIVDSEWNSTAVSPLRLDQKNTQMVYIRLVDEDLDEHCSRARAFGAEILQEPETQFYGERNYRARDPEGHTWTFVTTVAHVNSEEAMIASGFTIDGWHQK